MKIGKENVHVIIQIVTPTKTATPKLMIIAASILDNIFRSPFTPLRRQYNIFITLEQSVYLLRPGLVGVEKPVVRDGGYRPRDSDLFSPVTVSSTVFGVSTVILEDDSKIKAWIVLAHCFKLASISSSKQALSFDDNSVGKEKVREVCSSLQSP